MGTNHLHIAELMIRLFAGILFIFQGYDKLFRVGAKSVKDVFRSQVQGQHIHPVFISAMVYYTSLVEFFGGILLFLGLYTNLSLYALGIDLLLVSLAFSYLEAMWDMKHVFPRFVLVATLLLLPDEYRSFCLDHIFKIN